jgi:hypothetical protein
MWLDVLEGKVERAEVGLKVSMFVCEETRHTF